MGSLHILPPGSQLWRSTTIECTSVPQRWIQNWIHMILIFSDQEDALLTTGGLLREIPEEFRRQFVAEMHSNLCKYLQECGDKNLENVLTAHIIFPVLGDKPQPRCNPHNPLILQQSGGLDWKRNVTHWSAQLRGDFGQCSISL